MGALDRGSFTWLRDSWHLECLGAASGQRSPRDSAPFCVAGAASRRTGCCFCVGDAALTEPGRCLGSTVAAGPRTLFILQVQHLVLRMLLRGRCTQRAWALPLVNGRRGTAHAFAWKVQHLESVGAASGQRLPRDTTQLTGLISHKLLSHKLILQNSTHLTQLISDNLS